MHAMLESLKEMLEGQQYSTPERHIESLAFLQTGTADEAAQAQTAQVGQRRMSDSGMQESEREGARAASQRASIQIEGGMQNVLIGHAEQLVRLLVATVSRCAKENRPAKEQEITHILSNHIFYP